jgi:hypothetical protein
VRYYVIALLVVTMSLVMLSGCKTMTFLGTSQNTVPNTDDVITIKANLDSVNIRPNPSTEKPAIAAVRGGSRLGRIKEKGNWLKVSYTDSWGNNVKGWVYKYLVEGYTKPKAGGSAPSPMGEPSSSTSGPSPMGEPSSSTSAPSPMGDPSPMGEPSSPAPEPKTQPSDKTVSPM